MALLLFTGGAVFAAEPVGKAVAVIGAVDVFRAPETTSKPMAPNDPVYLDDRIVTGVGSQAKLILRDASILKIGPSSELSINQQVIGPGEASQTRINLLKGRLRSLIGETLGPLSRYEVHTKVAVTGVRGTDFEVWVRSVTDTAVRAFEGQVEVRNILREILGTVVLTPHTFTVVTSGAPPLAPAPIAPNKSLQQQLGGGAPEPDAADEQALEQVEEQQLQERDFGESSEAGAHVITGIKLETGIGGGAPAGETVDLHNVVQDTIFGDVTGGQLQTITQPVAPGGIEVPIQVEIPTP